jgi:hypothetical protein
MKDNKLIMNNISIFDVMHPDYKIDKPIRLIELFAGVGSQAMALNASPVGNAGGYSYLYKTDYRIRKLTPKECWRLMGFTDEDFYKAEEVNSNTQLYKQAGNSIVVKVLEAIFKQML